MRWIAISFMLGCCLVTNVTAAQERENIARGKKYILQPRPNYHLCTDPQDKIQLTDGIYTRGYFWTQQSTVGLVANASKPQSLKEVREQRTSCNRHGQPPSIYLG